MLKKTLATAALAGAIILGGASAALADTYPPAAVVTAGSASIGPGGSTVITATGLEDFDVVTFGHNAPSGTLSSIVAASAIVGTIDKPVVNGAASATFTASQPGNYTVSVFAGGALVGSVAVSVAGDSASGSGAGNLPPTGGSVPAAAIWVGVGAIGLGGIGVAAVAARRRTQKR